MDIPQIVGPDDAKRGEMGQQLLATGKSVALRRWRESSGQNCNSPPRAYETVGYLVSGKLEVQLDGESAIVNPGDSWLVPAGANHQYRVIEDIVAVEATSPPARFQSRDQAADAAGSGIQ